MTATEQYNQNTEKPRQLVKRAYTVAEVAQILDISRSKAYDICTKGDDFKVIRIGKSIRISKASFDSWLESME